MNAVEKELLVLLRREFSDKKVHAGKVGLILHDIR